MPIVNAQTPSLPPLDVSLSPQERFEEYLQTRGLRQTSQRKYLIGEVFASHDHFDADELIERLPRRGEKNYVSPATVYRTLRDLVEAGLLRSFQLDGRTVFEHDYGYPQHDHLYCTRCRKLLEFQSDALMKLRDEVAAEQGFRVSGHRMISKASAAIAASVAARNASKTWCSWFQGRICFRIAASTISLASKSRLSA